MKSHDRASDKTTITASVPRSLKTALVRLAKADGRSLSNWLVMELQKIVHSKTAGSSTSFSDQAPILRAAEAEGKYRGPKRA